MILDTFLSVCSGNTLLIEGFLYSLITCLLYIVVKKMSIDPTSYFKYYSSSQFPTGIFSLVYVG